MVAVWQPSGGVGCIVQLSNRIREPVSVLLVLGVPESIFEFIPDRCRRSLQRSETVDLKAEDRFRLRAIYVFNGGIHPCRVHSHTLYREGLAARTDIQHGKVECVRAIEVDRLRVGAGRRVSITNQIMQTWIVL